jgi:hypothetical protein
MTSYIIMTRDRFKSFDISQGFPFRELVGCLLWIILCVMGPELLRVKDLARKSNSFGEVDYLEGLKVLQRIFERREHGIVIYRHASGKELVPASSLTPAVSELGLGDNIGMLIGHAGNELSHQSLCKARSTTNDSPYVVDDSDGLDLYRAPLPVNHRYSLVVFGDASFAVGELKQSVKGYVIYLNGVPLLWGSLKQTIRRLLLTLPVRRSLLLQAWRVNHLFTLRICWGSWGLHAKNLIGCTRIRWLVYTLPLIRRN